jgi:LPS export ABC transporter protein LptC
VVGPPAPQVRGSTPDLIAVAGLYALALTVWSLHMRSPRLLAVCLLSGVAHLYGAALPAFAEEGSRTLDLTALTYVGSSGERSDIVLAASTARVLPDREQVFLATVDLTVAGPDVKAGLKLTCAHGELDLASGNFVGIGDVQGVTSDGRHFETERFQYDHEAGIVTTDAPVVIRGDTGTLRGRGFRYAVKDGHLQLLGGATVVAQ